MSSSQGVLEQMKQCDAIVGQLESPVAPRAEVSAVVAVGGVVGFAGLVALGAQVRVPVPWTDVPMTLQVLAVLLAGFLLPRRRAVAAMTLYLVCGAAGLPVFAAGSGGLLGSTGGYLAGFAVAAWLVSTLSSDGKAGFARLFAAGTAGFVVIFAMGAAWRAWLVLGFGALNDHLWTAIAAGVIPFLLKAVVELLLAVTLAMRLRGARGENRSVW